MIVKHPVRCLTPPFELEYVATPFARVCSTRELKTTDLPRLSGHNPDVNGHFGVEGQRAAWKGGSRSGGARRGGGHVFGGEKDEVM